MQRSATIAIVILLVVTSLSIGINIGFSWNNHSAVTTEAHDKNSPSTPPANPSFTKPTPTITLQPPGTPYYLSYTELKRETVENETKIIITINAQYNWGNPTSIDYQRFRLDVFIIQGGLAFMFGNLTINSDTVAPLEHGQYTISATNQAANFQLTFQFPDMQNNSDGPVPFSQFGSYIIQYNGKTIPTYP